MLVERRPYTGLLFSMLMPMFWIADAPNVCPAGTFKDAYFLMKKCLRGLIISDMLCKRYRRLLHLVVELQGIR